MTVTKVNESGDFLARIKGVGGLATYVGIPANSARNRIDLINKRAARFHSQRKKRRELKDYLISPTFTSFMSNAEVLAKFTRGSPLTNQPPRPVLEPAMHAEGNKEEISALVAESVSLYSKGQKYKSKLKLKSAGARAAKAARSWFTDPRNNWAPNAPKTIRAKGRDAPGLDTEIMRAAITHVEKEVPL